MEEDRDGKWVEGVWSEEANERRRVLAELNFLRRKRWRNWVRAEGRAGGEEEVGDEMDGEDFVERLREEMMAGRRRI